MIEHFGVFVFQAIHTVEGQEEVIAGSDAIDLKFPLEPAAHFDQVSGAAGSAGAASMTVLLAPGQLAPDGSGIFFGSAPPNGTFGIMNVAPGHYYAFALERWSSIWQNPDFLRQMESWGTSIDVQEFAHAQIQLPITTAEVVQQVAARLGLSAQ